MSLKTWKDEFYHVDADSKIIVDDWFATTHSLQKWRGLRFENLRKHGLIAGFDYIYDPDTGEPFYIGGESCALCKFHITCGNCVLAKYLGKRCDEDNTMPYVVWLDIDDPEPMILALEEIIKQHEGH